MAAASSSLAPLASGENVFWKKNEAVNRGIPEAIFIDNVEALCKDKNPTEVVGGLQELHSKYQYMSSSMASQKAGLKAKLPDIESALDTVNHLIDRNSKGETEPANYTYQLSENIWSTASAPPASNVCLWLGANCMLEYTVDEAAQLLRTNEGNAQTTLKTLAEDLHYLRDQITTTEVNIARCHNFGVKLRQQQKEGGQADKPKAAAVQDKPKAPTDAGSGGTKVAGPYTWKQTKEEVEVSVRMPKDAQKADVKVTILAESLKVEHAGKVIVEGDLTGKCSPNGSTWTMTGSRVEISLEKADATVQWGELFESI
ncbi:unnamed protein product [Polarella glacialis]|uniref:CS domain-containing protein n=3 Tax=Polarella glacialis TaxID=89957 RepID=A0A813HSD6_POLGL|nr:unnamed protein product [Polarella glacialis]